MAVDERKILNHYNLTNQFPTAWPAEKNLSDSSEDELPVKSVKHASMRRSKSRYSALERVGSERRRFVPGSEKTLNGVENLVQRDEADPLGGTDSVVMALRYKGLPVEDDQLLRNRFLLSSTTFSPALYLSQIQSNASSQSLLQGLDYLARSIDQKSASLKVLVESNFERFVRAKTTIDSVYAEMRNQGSEIEQDRPRTHSRITSRSSTQLRNISGQGISLTPNKRGDNKPLPSDKKKFALTKDGEYGTLGIKAPLIEVAVRAEEVWGPALGDREREQSLNSIAESIERSREVMVIGFTIHTCIKQRKDDKLVAEYALAQTYAKEARDLVDAAISSQMFLTDPQVHYVVIVGRMWLDVQGQLNRFKREAWRKLSGAPSSPASSKNHNYNEEYMSLISLLLELGVEDNPLEIWLTSRYESLKNNFNASFERCRVEIEVFRRRLANGSKPTPITMLRYLRKHDVPITEMTELDLDTAPVLELWQLIQTSLNNLLSIDNGLLSEVIEFWDRAQSLIDGRTQRTLPIGVNGRSRRHHRLSQYLVRNLQDDMIVFVEQIRSSIVSFFADPPIEDISMLYSPLSDTPSTTPNTPRSTVLSPFAHQDTRFQLTSNNPPPASPKRCESFENLAFWPPYANALSGTHYLGKILVLLATSAAAMTSLPPVASSATTVARLKGLVATARERSLQAICTAWDKDAEVCATLEDWTRPGNRRGLTNIPSLFATFENYLLSGIQKVMYIPEASISKLGSSDILTPPPANLLQIVRTQFVNSIFKTLSGMVQAANNTPTSNVDTAMVGSVTAARSILGLPQKGVEWKASVPSNPKIRLLLTMNNLKTLRAEILPRLFGQFETLLMIKLTEDKGMIHDALSQIDAGLFQAYIQPIVENLSTIVHDGVSSPSWTPSSVRPTDVKPYVYEALLLLVYVHTEVSTIAASLTSQVLSYLLEQLSRSLLGAFKSRPKYTQLALMQATIDVEFIAQTLSQYTTDLAAQIQSQVYHELDQNAYSDAMKKMQNELGEMKAILRGLKESTRNEFACFKRQRAQRERPDRAA